MLVPKLPELNRHRNRSGLQDSHETRGLFTEILAKAPSVSRLNVLEAL